MPASLPRRLLLLLFFLFFLFLCLVLVLVSPEVALCLGGWVGGWVDRENACEQPYVPAASATGARPAVAVVVVARHSACWLGAWGCVAVGMGGVGGWVGGWVEEWGGQSSPWTRSRRRHKEALAQRLLLLFLLLLVVVCMVWRASFVCVCGFIHPPFCRPGFLASREGTKKEESPP